MSDWQAADAVRGRIDQEYALGLELADTGFDALVLQAIERANPAGELYVVSDNLSSHDSQALRAWLVDHPRIRQVFIPRGRAG